MGFVCWVNNNVKLFVSFVNHCRPTHTRICRELCNLPVVLYVVIANFSSVSGQSHMVNVCVSCSVLGVVHKLCHIRIRELAYKVSQ